MDDMTGKRCKSWIYVVYECFGEQRYPLEDADANLMIRCSGSVVILSVEFRYYNCVLQQLHLFPISLREGFDHRALHSSFPGSCCQREWQELAV